MPTGELTTEVTEERVWVGAAGNARELWERFDRDRSWGRDAVEAGGRRVGVDDAGDGAGDADGGSQDRPVVRGKPIRVQDRERRRVAGGHGKRNEVGNPNRCCHTNSN